jgi:acetyltransferase-like isoleucine patch superfamily enzyme
MSTEATDRLHPLNPMRLFLAELSEPLIRLGGWAGAALGKDREGVEMVLRGRLLGGSAAWKVGRNVRFAGPCGRFRMGERVSLYGNSYLNATGNAGALSIGSDSHVDQFCVLYGQGGLEIGSACAIASGVIIYSQTNADGLHDGTPVAMQPAVYKPVAIGHGAWLGAGVRLLPGITLGGGCHVGAGAVVTQDMPAASVCVGIPARVVESHRD